MTGDLCDVAKLRTYETVYFALGDRPCRSLSRAHGLHARATQGRARSMKTADYLAKARATLADAQQIATLPFATYRCSRRLSCRVPCRRGLHFRTHRQDREDASWRAQRICPAGKGRGAYRARPCYLSRNRLSVQSSRRLWCWLNRRANHVRRSRRRHCHDDPLHRHHRPTAATGYHAADRATCTAVVSVPCIYQDFRISRKI